MTSVTTLLIRIDRQGDLILTLPVDQLPVLKSHNCVWLINKGLEFLPEQASPERQYQSTWREFSWKNFWSVFKFIKNLKPEHSISFHAPWWINFALFLNQVPNRIGVKSQWHSFLFLNKGVRQKRSESKWNELEYNAELVLKGLDIPFVDIKDRARNLQLHLTAKTASPEALSLMPKEPYVVVHPGMGGSALNLPTNTYVETIHALSQTQPVVITGTALDQKYIQPIAKELLNNKNVFWLNEKLNINDLLYILSKAKAFLGPSTGVTHLSASLGTPTLGVYPPVRVMSSTRWSPRGHKVTTVSPEVQCPGHFQCLGEACAQHPCMQKVTSKNLILKLNQLMS